jgi:clan AA aspartic protease
VIIGTVTADGEAIVELSLLRPDGTWQAIAAVIDTGFSGYLTLRPAAIASLGLQPLRQGTVVLGDGTIGQIDYYAGTILWDGSRRDVAIGAADIDPVIGMDLLHGHRLTIEVIPNGRTVIQALPVPR